MAIISIRPCLPAGRHRRDGDTELGLRSPSKTSSFSPHLPLSPAFGGEGWGEGASKLWLRQRYALPAYRQAGVTLW